MLMRQCDRLTGDEFQQLAARYFRSNKRWFASLIDTMNGKDVFCKVDSNGYDSHDFPFH
jgi:hypothetical protein